MAQTYDKNNKRYSTNIKTNNTQKIRGPLVSRKNFIFNLNSKIYINLLSIFRSNPNNFICQERKHHRYHIYHTCDFHPKLLNVIFGISESTLGFTPQKKIQVP